MPIKLHINFSKISKSRLYRKNGKDGAYGDLILFATPNGNSDYIVKMALSDEEFKEGIETDLPVIGCGKNVGKKD